MSTSLAGIPKARRFSGGGQGGGGNAGEVHRDGLNFKVADAIWKYRCVTGFRAPELFAKGESGWVQDYEFWARSLGANCVREFCMWQNTGFSPKDRGGEYYNNLEAHWLARKARGLYTHAVLFCDQVPGSSVLMDAHSQDAHVQQCVEIARRVGTVLLEINNENFKNGNFSQRFPREWFAGVPTTRSTWYGDEDPQAPGTWLDWSTYHTPRGDDFAAKGKVLHEVLRQGLGQYPAAHIPAVSGEPIRIAEGTTPRQHADDTMVCELYGSGRCLHGGYSSFDSRHQSDLQNCRVPTGLALECCEAVAAVWKSNLIDPRCAAEGRYVRGNADGQGECPIWHQDRTDDPQHGALRSYFMEFGGRMYGGAVDPGPQWQLRTREGWKVVDEGGYDGNVLVLSR